MAEIIKLEVRLVAPLHFRASGSCQLCVIVYLCVPRDESDIQQLLETKAPRNFSHDENPDHGPHHQDPELGVPHVCYKKKEI